MSVESGAVPPQKAIKDGQKWRIGTGAEVAWIKAATTVTKAVTAAIPPLFEAYSTIVLPSDWQVEQAAHDAALIDVLRAHSRTVEWWLGYLDTGADDIVFPQAAPVTLYAGWRYVLVEAGPDQAAAWRHSDLGSFWKGSLPNLMFPADRSWLSSTLWDDDWTCVGGSTALVDDLITHPVLGTRSRLITADQDATPPRYEAI